MSHQDKQIDIRYNKIGPKIKKIALENYTFWPRIPAERNSKFSGVEIFIFQPMCMINKKKLTENFRNWQTFSDDGQNFKVLRGTNLYFLT